MTLRGFPPRPGSCRGVVVGPDERRRTLSITNDVETNAGQPPDGPAPAPWRSRALRAGGAVSLGFVAGYGVALMRPAAVTATATPLALAAHAASEANLARTTADMAIEMERLADAERDYARFRGSRQEADSLMRAGLALSEALRAGGSYAVPLARVRGLDGGEDAIAPVSAALLRDVDGVPDRADLSAQLDAIAASVLALGEEEPQRWTTRMAQRIGALVRSDSRVAIQARRSEVFATARDAAARGALAEAMAALDAARCRCGRRVVGLGRGRRQRIALDRHGGPRRRAVMAAYAYR